jgi:hypothetical protein
LISILSNKVIGGDIVIDNQTRDSTGKGEVIQEHVTRFTQKVSGNDDTQPDAGCTTDIGCCKDVGCCEDEGCCQDQGCCNHIEVGSQVEPVHNRWDIAAYVKSDKEPIVTFLKTHSIDLDH